MSFRRWTSDPESARADQCGMDVWRDGRYSEGRWVAGSWARCEGTACFKNARGQFVCNDCKTWAEREHRNIAHGWLLRADQGGLVVLKARVPAAFRERVRAAAKDQDMTCAAYIRAALVAAMRRNERRDCERNH